MTHLDELLTVTDAAEKLKKSDRWVLDELRAKRLRGAKVGGAWTIKAGDLDVYIEARMNMARIRRRT
jgi:excisionase family DNA binding protein